MTKCVNCGGRSLTLTASGDFKKCADCGCSNIVVRPEHVAAASRMKSLLAGGWPGTQQEEGSGDE